MRRGKGEGGRRGEAVVEKELVLHYLLASKWWIAAYESPLLNSFISIFDLFRFTHSSRDCYSRYSSKTLHKAFVQMSMAQFYIVTLIADGLQLQCLL